VVDQFNKLQINDDEDDDLNADIDKINLERKSSIKNNKHQKLQQDESIRQPQKLRDLRKIWKEKEKFLKTQNLSIGKDFKNVT